MEVPTTNVYIRLVNKGLKSTSRGNGCILDIW